MSIQRAYRQTPCSTGYAIFTAIYGMQRAGVQTLGLDRTSMQVPCNRNNDIQHLHPEHEVLLIESGTGYYQIHRDDLLPVRAGQIVVLPGGLVHRLIEPRKLAMRGMLLHPDIFHAFINMLPHQSVMTMFTDLHHEVSPRVITHQHHYERFQELFEQSCLEYGARDAMQAPMLATIGRQVALQVSRLMQVSDTVQPQDSASFRVLRVQHWIDRHFLESIDLPQLAEMAQLSRSQFCALFQRVIGASPKAYLLRRRLNQAATLLAETDWSVTSIAMSVGFETLSSFNRDFKHYWGATPTDYRTKCIVDQS